MNLTLIQSAAYTLRVARQLARALGRPVPDCREAVFDLAWESFLQDARAEGIEPERLHPIREAEFLARPPPRAVVYWMGLTRPEDRLRPTLFHLSWEDADCFWATCGEHGATYHLRDGCWQCADALWSLPIDPEVERGLRLADMRERHAERAARVEAVFADVLAQAIEAGQVLVPEPDGRPWYRPPPRRAGGRPASQPLLGGRGGRR